MDNKITIEIDPEVILDLLKGCRIIIKQYEADVEYLLLSENPVQENHKIIAKNIKESLKLLYETRDNLRKAYDNYCDQFIDECDNV